jgi:hypothetical protein
MDVNTHYFKWITGTNDSLEKIHEDIGKEKVQTFEEDTLRNCIDFSEFCGECQTDSGLLDLNIRWKSHKFKKRISLRYLNHSLHKWSSYDDSNSFSSLSK